MATVTQEQDRLDRPPEAGEVEPVVWRVAIYLRSTGLGPEMALETARGMVREVLDEPSEQGEPLALRALDRAADRIDEWLDALAASCPKPTIDLRAQLRWHVRPVLQRHPEGLLRMRDLHDDFQRAVLAAAKPILPPCAFVVMPAQSLGDLPHLWHKMVVGCSLVWCRVMGRLRWKRTGQ